MKIFMSGIGGIGMSALAQLLAARGDAVTGSDRDASPVTEMLHEKGIVVTIGQKAENVADDTELLVYSAAVPESHPERARAKELGIPELSYFEMLGRVSEAKRTIAVSGTHGKTTTTGYLTKILIDAGASPTAVVGSLIKDFGSNYVGGESDLFVVEACEYQRHFLNLTPEVLVVTNIEFDHTDYFKNLADVQNAFAAMMRRVPAHGTIVTDTEHPNIAPLLEGVAATVVNYMDAITYTTRLPGTFNQANAHAAAAAARVALPGMDEAGLRASVAAFSGTWRRFEYKGTTASGADVYDDYAHHPTAIRETLSALLKKRDEEGKKRVIVAFHPHLYSRTRDLFDGFSRAFAGADSVIIAPIYAAREVDDGSVSAELLAEKVTENGTSARAASSLADVEAMLREEAKEGDILMTMGAGDIYRVADALTKP